jgi:hypothetical protein
VLCWRIKRHRLIHQQFRFRLSFSSLGV